MGRTARVVNLCFHGIGTPRRTLEPGEERYWISESEFLRILDEVAGEPAGRVRLSFDDANASDAHTALPALLERALGATFHLLSARIDQPGSLSADEARALAAAGMTIGNHGMDHVPWRGLDAAARHRELVEARHLLSATTGVAIREAALPLGRYDRRTLASLRAAGYDSVGTSDKGWAREGAWLQPRHSVTAADTVASVRAVLDSPGTPLVRARRGVVGVLKRWR